MPSHVLVAIVSLLALLLYFYMGMRVGRARGQFNVVAPAVTGSPDFERAYRVQMNTLEWLPLFLVSLWLFAIYWNERVAAAVGLVWIGRPRLLHDHLFQGRRDPRSAASASRPWPPACCSSARWAGSSGWRPRAESDRRQRNLCETGQSVRT